MKNFIFLLVLAFGVMSFTNTTNKSISNRNIYSSNIKNDEGNGLCHVTIINNQTNEVVYEVTLIAHNYSACVQMAEDTLNAFINGKL